MRGVMIAGISSNVGKTTVAMGIMAALRRRGLRVQPFKAGPDYIDPTYHTRMAGVPCRNLDTWMVPAEHVIELFHRASAGSDFAVAEGVMGLYDGRSSTTGEGSSAEVAKLLGLPVLLVLDASSIARSAAAIVQGFQHFDPEVRFAGVFLNRVGSPNHARICQEAIEAATGIPVLGFLQRDAGLTLPERHLGLVPAVEGQTADKVFNRIASSVAAGLDMPRLLDCEVRLPTAVEPSGLFPVRPQGKRARIAVAMDRSFSFYYRDGLDLLEAWGAEIAPFSTLEDAGLPAGTTGVYIGGGFPEQFARELSENRAMAASLHNAAQRGIPIYAECGGLMYLGQTLTDMEGNIYPMAGLVPFRSRLHGSRLTLGYREATARSDGPLLLKGQTVRGHEFHWSQLESPPPSETAAYELAARPQPLEGWQRGSIFASYVHLHMAADARLAPRFVQQCTPQKGNPQ